MFGGHFEAISTRFWPAFSGAVQVSCLPFRPLSEGMVLGIAFSRAFLILPRLKAGILQATHGLNLPTLSSFRSHNPSI